MMQHRVPGTYILRELSEVVVPPALGWWPQTLGWQLLALLMGALLAWRLGRRGRRWWQRRYRREALRALDTLCWSDAGAGLRLLHILKTVLIHLAPHHANLYGMPLLVELDRAMPDGYPRFATPLGERWLSSLVTRQVQLSMGQQLQLTTISRDWLLGHQAEERASPVRAPRSPEASHG